MHKLRLGVNIDHVATLRNARGQSYPDPIAAALMAQRAGADGITAHLREDRRHIRDDDIFALKQAIEVPLNFEMAATDEMVSIAEQLQPHAACIVPERREEVTTEGGLSVAAQKDRLMPLITRLKHAGCRVSLFIDADDAEIAASAEVGADIVELHTGPYCHAASSDRQSAECNKLQQGALIAERHGLEVHAGHGLTFDNVRPVAAIPQMKELNIGHFLIGTSVFIGLSSAIEKMRQLMDEARTQDGS